MINNHNIFNQGTNVKNTGKTLATTSVYGIGEWIV